MRIVPHHSPMHLRLDWKTFVTREWTMPRPDRDLTITNKTDVICQERFSYNQIVSCIPGKKPDGWVPIPGKPMFSGHLPQYELQDNGSGKAYRSIVHLRRDKILSFLRVARWEWIDSVLVTRYEDLLEHGTASMLKTISKRTGLVPNCDASPRQKKGQRALEKDFVRWMKKNVDWKVEELIGYQQPR